MSPLAVQKPVENVGLDTSYGAAYEENVCSDGGHAKSTPSESGTRVHTKLVASFFPRVVTLVVVMTMVIALVQRFPGNDVPKTVAAAAAATTSGAEVAPSASAAAVGRPAQRCDSDGFEQQNAKSLEPGVLRRISRESTTTKTKTKTRNVLVLGDSTDKIWTIGVCAAQILNAGMPLPTLHTSSPREYEVPQNMRTFDLSGVLDKDWSTSSGGGGDDDDEDDNSWPANIAPRGPHGSCCASANWTAGEQRCCMSHVHVASASTCRTPEGWFGASHVYFDRGFERAYNLPQWETHTPEDKIKWTVNNYGDFVRRVGSNPDVPVVVVFQLNYWVQTLLRFTKDPKKGYVHKVGDVKTLHHDKARGLVQQAKAAMSDNGMRPDCFVMRTQHVCNPKRCENHDMKLKLSSKIDFEKDEPECCHFDELVRLLNDNIREVAKEFDVPLFDWAATVDGKLNDAGSNPWMLEKCHQTLEASMTMKIAFDEFIEANLPAHCFGGGGGGN